MLVACTGQAIVSTENTSITGDASDISTNTSQSKAATPSTKPEQFENLWQRIRAGYALQKLDSPLIARHEQWFSSNPEYMDRLFKRASLYLFYIVEEVDKRGLPMEIALLPAIESAFKPHAYSRARASGLWQFIPSTGRYFGLERNWWYDGRRDVFEATKAALDYLEKLNKIFDGDWHLALAAYNAGERRILRAQEYNRRRGRPTDFAHLKSYKRETQNYVPKLIAMTNIVAHPEKYGVTLVPIPNEPYFTRVEIGSQIDLGLVAKMANISMGDLYDINPGFKRWATAPNGPHYILVPADRREVLLEALDQLPDDKRVRWTRHRIRQGDTLSTIGRRYRVSVRAIKQANRLRGTRIRAGDNLLIPISTRRLTAYNGNVTKPVKRKIRILPPPKDAVQLIHRVQRGDTLWGIARRYQVYLYQLKGWNGLRRRLLLPGQELKVWVKPGFTPTASTQRTLPRT